jgi:hypothetical protein
MQVSICDGKSIFSANEQFCIDNQLDLQKMVMFTSDGATAMLGKHKGEAALLKKEVPHLTEQRCVSDREDLGIDDLEKMCL